MPHSPGERDTGDQILDRLRRREVLGGQGNFDFQVVRRNTNGGGARIGLSKPGRTRLGVDAARSPSVVGVGGGAGLRSEYSHRCGRQTVALEIAVGLFVVTEKTLPRGSMSLADTVPRHGGSLGIVIVVGLVEEFTEVAVEVCNVVLCGSSAWKSSPPT